MLQHYINAYERNKTESAIFISLTYSLLPKDLHSELILSSLQLAAVKRLPVHHHIVQIVYFLVLWDH